MEDPMSLNLNPLIAAGVVASTAATDAVYVMFNAAVTARRPTRAASWSALWYLLSAFAVISYTGNSIYVVFAASGSWIGAYFSVRWLSRSAPKTTPGGPAALGNPPV
jgi:hypothetical protein